MNLLEKTDQEIIDIANPIWENLVKSSNIKDYGGFTKDFSSQMLFGANEVELGKQWSNNKLLTSLSDKKEVFGCLRRDKYVTVLYKQTSNALPGEFLGRLVLGVEDDEIKIFGITEIDTTWFGFDAPTKFNAWEVLNPIAIEVELIAKRK